MIEALLYASLAAAIALAVQFVFVRQLKNRYPERERMIALGSITFGAVLGGVIARAYGWHVGGAFIGGAVGFVIALYATNADSNE